MSIDVERLTREHQTAVTSDDGIKFYTVPSLISQLREAIFGGMETTGGRTKHAPKLPISAEALDLYQTIDREITAAWVTAFKQPPNANRPEALLAQWAAWASPETETIIGRRTMSAPAAVKHWEQRITDFFDPPRSAEINAPCPEPECGQRYVHGETDGQNIRSSALHFTRDRTTGQTLDARCRACGQMWTPQQFERLAALIGIDVQEKLAHMTETR